MQREVSARWHLFHLGLVQYQEQLRGQFRVPGFGECLQHPLHLGFAQYQEQLRGQFRVPGFVEYLQQVVVGYL